ncbi:hypothetical protein ABFV43_11165 [Pseudomonas fulva]|uniref:hypothetical protein n=1 Tax=Pseudomonas TaxID=286 RepID=UPI00071F8EE9|nr:hypothetical protein [Pseudomonas sp. URMO17WK12:I11]CRN04628.1 hypothetical protein PYEL_03450 [Pseudomonas sp. URMO17WK12:I11]
MYHHYKPFRNFVRQLDRTVALRQIYYLSQNIQYGKPLPVQFAQLSPKGIASIKDVVYQWELDVLAREVILNAGTGGGKDLFNVKDFRTAIGHIRRLQDRQIEGRLQTMIYQELHRLFQLQFPWQSKAVELRLSRFLRMFKCPDVENVLMAALGLTVKEIYIIGGAIAGSFLTKDIYDLNADFSGFGIESDRRDKFFGYISAGVNEVRVSAESLQEYNENWSYTLNPLRRTPLVSISAQAPNIVICPIPEFILLRISEGLHYDLVNVGDFNNAYGKSFERYVGEISSELVSHLGITAKAGQEYWVGKKVKKHGVDWYMYDASAVMLIECKTKGLKLDARYKLEENDLHAEIELLAKFVVQNYKNLIDIQAGYTPWDPEGRKLYPVVVTLSNWYLHGQAVTQHLEDTVLTLLDNSQIDRKVVNVNPYTIMSIEEYEVAIQVIGKVGVDKFFDEISKSDYKGWMVSPFMESCFPDEVSGVSYDYLRSEITSIQKEMESKLNGTRQ